MALIGLAVLWPVLVIVTILVKVKMPGGPAFFVRNGWGRMEGCSRAISSVR